MTRRRLTSDYPITVDEEVDDYFRGTVHPELYRWTLCRFLLPHLGRTTTRLQARRSIELARDHEASMWRRYPDGPETAAVDVDGAA